MRIKRFVTKDMREAIRRIRDELGPDAVILSSRRTDEGVETTAAIDYDAQADATSTPVVPEQRDVARSAPSAPQPDVVERRASTTSERVDAHRPMTPRVPESDLASMYDELRSLRTVVTDQLSRLAWSDGERRAPVRAEVITELLALGFGQRLAQSIADEIAIGTPSSEARRMAFDALAGRFSVTDHDLVADGGIFALIGATGVGKTTTVAKLAARFALRHGPEHVALVTTDNYRIGAYEQLRTFARIMGVPMRVVNDEQELKVAIRHFYDRRLVLVDTAGMSQRDRRFSSQIGLIARGSAVVRTYLVLSATTQWAGVEEAARAFGANRVDGCVITKADECASLGPALTTVAEHRLPVAFVSNGQRVPEDLHRARPEDLVARAISLAATTITDSVDRDPGAEIGRALDARG